MFWAFIMTIPTIIITHKIINYYYPIDSKQLAIKTAWNALELCSRFEIYFSNIYNKIKYYIPQLCNNPHPTITFIGDGHEIVTYSLSEFTNIIKNGKIILKYDFVLYEIPIIFQDKYDKYDKYTLRYENHIDIMNIEYHNSANTFDLNMIQFTFKKSKDTYKIDFGKNNFNIDGNILFDRKFIKWYLNKKHSVILNEDDEYNITFIDHNMNYINLPQYCYIIIDKKNYNIINDISDDNLNMIDDLIIEHNDSSLSSSVEDVADVADVADVEEQLTKNIKDPLIN